MADANHECNNQLAYLLSNLQNLAEYADDLSRVLAAYRKRVMAAGLFDAELEKLETQTDLDFLLGDFGRAVREGLQGATRLRDILRIVSRVNLNETGEKPVAQVGHILRSVLGIQGKAVSARARLEVGDDLEVNAAGAPALVTRAFAAMLKHALRALDPQTRDENVLRVDVQRRDGGRVVIAVERLGGGIAGAQGLELAEGAAEELHAALEIEPMRSLLVLVEAPESA